MDHEMTPRPEVEGSEELASARRRADRMLVRVGPPSPDPTESSLPARLVALASSIAASVAAVASSMWHESGSRVWIIIVASTIASAGVGLSSALVFRRRVTKRHLGMAVVPADNYVFTFERAAGRWELRAIYRLDGMPASSADLFVDGEPLEGSIAFDADEFLRSLQRSSERHDA